MKYRRWLGLLLVVALAIVNLSPADFMKPAIAESETAEAISMPLSELIIDDMVVVADYEVIDGQFTKDYRTCGREIRIYPHEPFTDGETITVCFTNVVSTAGITAEFLKTETQAHPEIREICILQGESCKSGKEPSLFSKF